MLIKVQTIKVQTYEFSLLSSYPAIGGPGSGVIYTFGAVLVIVSARILAHDSLTQSIQFGIVGCMKFLTEVTPFFVQSFSIQVAQASYA